MFHIFLEFLLYNVVGTFFNLKRSREESERMSKFAFLKQSAVYFEQDDKINLIRMRSNEKSENYI